MAFWDDVLTTAEDIGTFGSSYIARKAGLPFPDAGDIYNQLFSAPGGPTNIPDIPAPPTPPELSDELVKRARMATAQRQLAGQGLTSGFLTGPMGLRTPAPISTPSLVGS